MTQFISKDISKKNEDDFNVFLYCLTEASKEVKEHYFLIDVANSANKIDRERVYCYELYHQMRCKMTIMDRIYMLDGELDKKGHTIIKNSPKPDFLVHGPGKMENNLVIIEVKRADAEINDIKKDIRKLKQFVDKYSYSKGIMLIYGNAKPDFQDRILSEMKTMMRSYKKRDSILLMLHQSAGQILREVWPEGGV